MEKGNSSGTLVLGIERGDEIQIEYAKKEIMDKINSYFGYNLINKIKLQVLGSESYKKKDRKITEKFSKDFQKKINEIKNESIKNSLSQLLKAIKND